MRRIYDFYKKVINYKIPTLAGSLCFFLLINGGSFLFLIVSITSNFIDFNNLINNLLKDGMLKDILLYLTTHNSNLSNNIILGITSLYSSSSLYYHLLSIGEFLTDNKIDYKLNKRIISLIFSLIILLIIFLLFIISSLMPFIFHTSPIYTYILIGILLIIIIYFSNVIILKKYAFKALYKGIFFNILYSIVFTILFVLFLMFFRKFKIVYGYFSLIIIFLFYIYFLIIGLLIGIKINWKLIEEYK